MRSFIYYNINRNIKPRRTRWAAYVARIGKTGMHTGFLVEKPKGRSLGRPKRRRGDIIKIDL
jgi:hypothetical protein